MHQAIFSKFFDLNEVGALIWNLIAGERTLKRIIEGMK